MNPEDFRKVFDSVKVVPDPEEEAREKRKEETDFRAKLHICGIEKRFADCTFEKIEGNGIPKEIQKHYEQVKEYAEHFDEYFSKGIGVMFMGGVGRMKTTMAVAIAQHVLKRGKSAYFISMAELLDKMISMSKNTDRSELQRFENTISQTNLLILDDLGMEYPSDWVLNKVDAIITSRYNKMLPIVITTNLIPAEINTRYMERIYDRLKSTSISIIETGRSLRRLA